MNKPPRSFPRPLSELTAPALSDVLRRQGFASTEIVARWAEIAGPDIAAHSEPIRINWPRHVEGDAAEAQPATLVLRVEGPAALEIQHQSALILERLNRFFGWAAVGRVALRQAPLSRRERPAPAPVNRAEAERIASTIPVEDEGLRNALGRLGAAIKRT